VARERLSARFVSAEGNRGDSRAIRSEDPDMALAAKQSWRPWRTPLDPEHDTRLAPKTILREVALVLLLTFAYFLTRGLIAGRTADALTNARNLISLEQALHLDVEHALQTFVMHQQWLLDFVNLYYLAGHLPVLIGVAVWLYWRHPSSYAWFRNAFLISAAIGLSIYVWLPMAPPRYMPGFVDTMAQNGNGLDGSAFKLLYNPYAAMPSLHCGWAAMAGIVVFMTARPWWGKLIGVLIPCGMIFTVVASGNHYLLDVVAGLIIIVAALILAAWQLVRSEDRRQARIIQNAILASVSGVPPSYQVAAASERGVDSGPVGPITQLEPRHFSAGAAETPEHTAARE
jgi:membrane-associated phospholipid phosphatase